MKRDGQRNFHFSTLHFSVLGALLIHAAVLFGWKRAFLEESAFGVGQDKAVTVMQVATLAPEMRAEPPPAEVMPPIPDPVVEKNEFLKKVVPVKEKPRQNKITPKKVVQTQNQQVQQTTSSQVGENVGEARSQLGNVNAQPDYLNNPPPKYPTESRRGREEGTVLLLVNISSQGRVISLSLEKSSGFARLDLAASEAVNNWKFKPAMIAGITVDSSVEVPIKFVLK